MGWFFITVLLPALAPLIAVLCMRILPIPLSAAKLSVVNVFKDGQLCWAAIGVCISGLYELGEAAATGAVMNFDFHHYLLSALVATLVVASVFAAGGAVFLTPHERPRGVSWVSHFRLMSCSLGVMAIAAFLYSVVHFGFFTH